MHDRRRIREARSGGGSIRGIAREFGASRNAVRRALDPDASLEYERPSMSEEFEPAVHDVLTDYPRMSVEQVAELVEWPGARRTLSDLVARVRQTVLDREVEDLPRPRFRSVTFARPSFPPAQFARPAFRSLYGDEDSEASRVPDRTA